MIFRLTYLGREITFFPERQVQIVSGRLHPLTHEEWFKNLSEVKRILNEARTSYKIEQIETTEAEEIALLKPFMS